MNDKGIRVKSTPPFKLKDKAQRYFQIINLKKQFGFIPEVIIVEKVKRETNKIIIRAVLTEEEIKKEDALIKSLEKKHAKNKPASQKKKS